MNENKIIIHKQIFPTKIYTYPSLPLTDNFYFKIINPTCCWYWMRGTN